MAISKPSLNELRYVNGQPDPNLREDQTRIMWIKNNEPITGTTGDTVSDGVLNRPIVQTQENIITLLNNSKSQQTTITELTDEVNALTGGDGSDFGGRISKNEDRIDDHQLRLSNTETSLGKEENFSVPSEPILATGLFLKANLIRENVGYRNVLDKKNPNINDDIRSDLWFLKQRIGNVNGYDENDNENSIKKPTGLYGEVVRIDNLNSTQGLEIKSAIGRIVKLEDNSLTGDISELRDELGEKDSTVEQTIYERLFANERALSDHETTISTLDDTINAPVLGLIAVVDSNVNNIRNIQTALSESSQTLTNVTLDIGTYTGVDLGSIKPKISALATEDATIWNYIGKTVTDTGTLSYKIKSIEDQIGIESTADTSTLWGLSTKNSTDYNSISLDIGEYDSVNLGKIKPALSTLSNSVNSLDENRTQVWDYVGTDDSTLGTLSYRINELEEKSNPTLLSSDLSDRESLISAINELTARIIALEP